MGGHITPTQNWHQRCKREDINPVILPYRSRLIFCPTNMEYASSQESYVTFSQQTSEETTQEDGGVLQAIDDVPQSEEVGEY